MGSAATELDDGIKAALEAMRNNPPADWAAAAAELYGLLRASQERLAMEGIVLMPNLAAGFNYIDWINDITDEADRILSTRRK